MPIKLYISQANQAHNAGPHGYTEKAGMIAIQKRVAKLLAKDPRFTVRCSPTSGIDTATENSIAANAWGAQRYLALHSNAGMRGTIAFYHSRSPQGKALAEAIVREVAPLSPGKETGDRVQTRDGFIEVHVPDCPAVLVELEAHDWAGGVAWLTGKREEIALALYRGVCRGCGLTPRDFRPFVTVRVRRSVWQLFKKWLDKHPDRRPR
jgi:N-acetylmuramoyl-L-alanine amidase